MSAPNQSSVRANECSLMGETDSSLLLRVVYFCDRALFPAHSFDVLLYKLGRSRTAKSPNHKEDSSHRSRLPPAVNESRQQASKQPSSGQPADHSAAAARTAPTAAPAAATPLPLGRPAFSARAAGSLKFGVETGLRASVPRQRRIETTICRFPVLSYSPVVRGKRDRPFVMENEPGYRYSMTLQPGGSRDRPVSIWDQRIRSPQKPFSSRQVECLPQASSKRFS
ncbi:hypothetical protein IWX90DRAFT_415780 [Phyllosticta citrichinensis]|uniref:Uncharacterized protein n=1 Tax=Phyllosticta citrichinensis TaxID=1130410 RepID=A0ABR1XQN0_9PEZI